MMRVRDTCAQMQSATPSKLRCSCRASLAISCTVAKRAFPAVRNKYEVLYENGLADRRQRRPIICTLPLALIKVTVEQIQLGGYIYRRSIVKCTILRTQKKTHRRYKKYCSGSFLEVLYIIPVPFDHGIERDRRNLPRCKKSMKSSA